MTAPRVDWHKGGPEDGLAVIDVAPDPDPLHTDADTTGYHPDIAAIRRRHGMDREPSRSGMVVLYGALAIAGAVLAIAYLWTRAQS